MTIEWSFPPISTDLNGVAVNSSNPNATILSYLIAAKEDPPTGSSWDVSFGTRAAYLGDEIKFSVPVRYGDPSSYEQPTNITQYCLKCLDWVTGDPDWEACDNRTTPLNDGSPLWNHTFLFPGTSSTFTYKLPKIPSLDTAVCTFMISGTSPLNLTFAFPYINYDHLTSKQTFSADYPAGDGATSTRSSYGYPTGSSSYYSGSSYSDPNSGMSPGSIAGTVIGVVLAVILLFGFLNCVAQSKKNNGQSKVTKPAPAGQARPFYGTAANQTPLSNPRPTRRPPQDAQSRAERGEAGDRDEMPPPAYEQAVAEGASSASTRQRQREENERRDLETALERSREEARAREALTPPWDERPLPQLPPEAHLGGKQENIEMRRRSSW